MCPLQDTFLYLIEVLGAVYYLIVNPDDVPLLAMGVGFIERILMSRFGLIVICETVSSEAHEKLLRTFLIDAKSENAGTERLSVEFGATIPFASVHLCDIAVPAS